MRATGEEVQLSATMLRTEGCFGGKLPLVTMQRGCLALQDGRGELEGWWTSQLSLVLWVPLRVLHCSAREGLSTVLSNVKSCRRVCVKLLIYREVFIY